MASGISSADIKDAVSRVQVAFPFENYIRVGERHAINYLVSRIAHFTNSSQNRLLDIGSGPLDKTAVFAQLGFDCSAVDDLSDLWHRRDNNLDLILGFARKMNINFHLQSYNDYSIPFPLDSFDIATIFAVIEHLHESPRGILNSAGTYLKEDGVLCITMPNSVNLRKRLSVMLGKTNYPPVDQFYHNEGQWRGHVREYTLSETVYIIKEAGFEILEATTYEEFAYNKLSPPLLQFYLLFGRIFPSTRSMLCVIARKPKGWKPITHDPKRYRQAIAASVPGGIK